MVGARGFEPPTSSSQSWRTTRLCNTPNDLRMRKIAPCGKNVNINIYTKSPQHSRTKHLSCKSIYLLGGRPFCLRHLTASFPKIFPVRLKIFTALPCVIRYANK